MDAWERLTRLANERFSEYLAMLPGDTPAHKVEFSRRITTSWALIYYRRRLVRLSPFLFLLSEDELKRGTHWKELDATLRHEAAHAWLYHRTGETGHSPRFHDALARLGVVANGGCDLGPENAAWRYVYSCPGCRAEWPRRTALKGNWSCGQCAPGKYDPRYQLALHHLEPPTTRLAACVERVEEALREAAADAPMVPLAVATATPAILVRAR